MGKRGKGSQTYERVRMDSGQHRRIGLVMLILGFAAFLPAAAKLGQLMVADYNNYAGLALRNQSRTTRVSAERGTIYDRNMNILAVSEPVENVFLDPHELKQSGADIDKIAEYLGGILEKDPQWIRDEAVKYAHRYRQIGWGISRETADRIRAYMKENKVCGIHLEPGNKRVYPCGSLAAQLIGFTNAAGEGVEGIEAAYDIFLTGESGKVVTTKGNNELDMPFSYENYIAAQRGDHVILTVDTVVQSCLEKHMESAIARYDVQNGAFGLVMNCKTGEILAMATLGSFDPNEYLEIADPQTAAETEALRLAYLMEPEGSEAYVRGKERYQQAVTAARLKQWRNRVISDGYEPGSTFKILTMAAALDCGAIDLNTHFHCSGSEQIPGRAQKLHCWRAAGHGAQQTPQALQNSCNLAFAHIALKLGGDQFYEYIRKFGILEKTGIDLKGEGRGVFFDKKLITDTGKWGTASLTSGSFGQTFKITPLQLVTAIASVVNGGYLLEPYVVSEILDEEGNVLLKQEPAVVRRTVSEETSKLMRELILGVVTDGTAKNASVAGFSVGGKTGTSEKIDVFDENGRRVQDKIVSFVGIAPMEDPEYIVMVALDTPSRNTGIYISGGVMAAPTVGAVMADILPYLEVPRNAQADMSHIILEDLKGLSPKEAVSKLEKQGLQGKLYGSGESVVAQLPAAGQVVSSGSQILIYLEQPGSGTAVTVPDFSGMNRQQANDEAGKLGLPIRITGNTDVSPSVVVTKQSFLPGSTVETGTVIILEFTDTTARD